MLLLCFQEVFVVEKRTDVYNETERIRRQIAAERQIQEELRKEISSLNAQLNDSKEGLQAASRLADQLGKTKDQNTRLKDEGMFLNLARIVFSSSVRKYALYNQHYRGI